MIGYRSCYYNNKKSTIHLQTWNEDGERIEKQIYFEPYLFIKDEKATNEYVSIFGDKLKKMTFENDWKRRDFVNNYNCSFFNNFAPEQQFLLDYYKGFENERITNHDLKIFYLDIEVHSPDEFPDPKVAKAPINAIAVFDTEIQKFIVFGLEYYSNYSVKDDIPDGSIDPLDIEYIKCSNETDLLKKFIRFWRKSFPDAVVGYNSNTFDIPYIMNRIDKVLGEEKNLQLSPYDKITFKDVQDRFGNEYREYTIKGVSHFDYMVLYRTYKNGINLDSFTLNAVAESELGSGKVAFDAITLSDLAKTDYEKFINYNIQDVNLLVRMEKKLKFLQLARFLTNLGFCNMDKALGKVGVISGILAKRALEKNLYLKTDKVIDKGTAIKGGFVKDATIGIRKDVIYFDANSLYPNTVITLNISPETKVGKVKRDGDNYIIIYKDKKYKFDKNQFKTFLQKENLTVSGAGILFDQSRMGILPEFCDYLYQKRDYNKKEMLKRKSQKNDFTKDSPEYKQLDDEATGFDMIQNVYKTVLNSAYGVLLNRFFPIYDPDCGQSITLSGQAVIKRVFKIINGVMAELVGEERDYVVCGDTDSVAVELSHLAKKHGIQLYDEQFNLTKEYQELEDDISKKLNDAVTEWVAENFNAKDIRYKFKRETVCPTAAYQKKKNYVLWSINKENVKNDELIYKGSLSKAIYSKKVKEKGRELIENLLKKKWSEKDCTHFLKEIKKDFMNWDVDDLGAKYNIKEYTKYAKNSKGFECPKGCPFHVKSSVYYNTLISNNKLGKLYPPITNGNKVKCVLLEKNQYGIDSLAYPDKFPKELGLVVDKMRMFEKTLLAYVKQIYESLDWNMPNFDLDYKVDLFQLLALNE